jgi:predicted phosphodiesterase
MKRVSLMIAAAGLMVSALALSGGVPKATNGDMQVEIEQRNPWTHLRINNGPETFHFVVVSDRTGGHRARVFSQAVEQINLLQPSFVVSVGDLIEGYTKDKKRLSEEWKEFQTYVARLRMPFFYVPGNHDLSNAVQVEEWRERLGRSYYHFLYRDVLFLALATDDQGEDKEYGQISMEQVEYFKKVLAANKNARWTILMLHKPVWAMPKFDQNNFHHIEKELAGRNYTVFAGHVHRYQKFVRQGMNYYQLATTGGVSRMRGLEYREFDHFVWVTMTKDGPVIANIRLDGVLPEDLKPYISDEEGSVAYDRRPPQPVKGRVMLDGAPMAGAKIVFNTVDPKTKKVAPIADAFVEPDGTYVMSSYKSGDGVPAGEYVVTIVWRRPYYTDTGIVGPNLAPERYAEAIKSNLTATVKTGPNEIDFNLTK